MDFPDLRQLAMKRGRSGHFHIAIYEIDEAEPWPSISCMCITNVKT